MIDVVGMYARHVDVAFGMCVEMSISNRWHGIYFRYPSKKKWCVIE